tara:strand:- start:353 stop:616 length:264 start_codon:yes stop_codon:yes gene_type:complete
MLGQILDLPGAETSWTTKVPKGRSRWKRLEPRRTLTPAPKKGPHWILEAEPLTLPLLNTMTATLTRQDAQADPQPLPQPEPNTVKAA